MEFLRGRWLVLVVVAPLFAGAIAFFAITSLDRSNFQSSGSLPLGRAIGEPSTPQDLDVQLESFTATLSSDENAETVAESLGTSIAEVQSALEAEIVAADIVQIRYGASSAETAEAGLRLAVQLAVTDLLTSDLRQVTLQREALETQRSDLAADLEVIQDRAGVSDVATEYRNLSSDILQLRNQVAAAQVNSSALAESLESLLQEKQLERDALGRVLREYEATADALNTTVSSYNSATSEVIGLEAQIDAAQGDELVRSVSVVEQSSLAATVRATVAAMVGAALMVIGAAVMVNRRQVEFAGTAGPPARTEGRP